MILQLLNLLYLELLLLHTNLIITNFLNLAILNNLIIINILNKKKIIKFILKNQLNYFYQSSNQFIIYQFHSAKALSPPYRPQVHYSIYQMHYLYHTYFIKKKYIYVSMFNSNTFILPNNRALFYFLLLRY